MNFTRARVAAAAASLTAVTAVTTGAFASAALASNSGSSNLLTVRSSSLVQDGLLVSWQIATTTKLRPAKLASEHSSLCLAITRDHGTQKLCLTAAKSGSHRILLARTSVAGKTSTIAPTVVRNSANSLTVTFAATAANITAANYSWRVVSARTNSCPATATSARYATACQTSISTAVQRFRFRTPKLVGCLPNTSSVVFNGSRAKRVVALTFDDGPWPDPPSIDFVNLLHRMGAVGTFFEIGDQISEYDPTGSVERAMLADGDMIGNHSWTHPDMANLSVAAQTAQLLDQRAAVKRATGFTECLFRPPYGDFDAQLVALAHSYGMATIQWDVDTVDWQRPGVSAIYSTAVNDARNGSIILMHFGGGNRDETIAALPMIIRTLRARGYSFVTVPELLGFKMIYR